ncbi:MAG TPA: helix-turn-helix domain-containing protein [Chryseolinea sp.]|nr:helix-turn-helix domain-containing protein [Chryseolinea sp.]
MELKLINAEELKAILYPVIRQALSEILAGKTKPDAEDLISFKQAYTLLGMAPSTLYNLVSQRRIPNSKKGKRLYFSKKELLAWIDSGKRKILQ